MFLVPERFINSKNAKMPVEFFICVTGTTDLVIRYYM